MAQKLAMATRGKQGLKPTVRQLCYLAGVMDSDGCFAISKMNAGIQRTKNPRYVFTMIVVNTSETLMKWLVEHFGGSYSSRRKQQSENHKITYDWFFNNGKALWLIKLIEPHLVIKSEQCRNAIQFLEGWKTNQSGTGSRTDDAEVARREAHYLRMKMLNQFGPVQPQRLSPLAPDGNQGDAIV